VRHNTSPTRKNVSPHRVLNTYLLDYLMTTCYERVRSFSIRRNGVEKKREGLRNSEPLRPSC